MLEDAEIGLLLADAGHRGVDNCLHRCHPLDPSLPDLRQHDSTSEKIGKSDFCIEMPSILCDYLLVSLFFHGTFVRCAVDV